MPGINQTILADKQLARAYTQRRKRVERAFKAMPRGSMRRCAEDTKTDKTSIWAVLRGKRTSESTLLKIEQWVREQEGVVDGDPSTEAENVQPA